MRRNRSLGIILSFSAAGQVDKRIDFFETQSRWANQRFGTEIWG